MLVLFWFQEHSLTCIQRIRNTCFNRGFLPQQFATHGPLACLPCASKMTYTRAGRQTDERIERRVESRALRRTVFLIPLPPDFWPLLPAPAMCVSTPTHTCKHSDHSRPHNIVALTLCLLQSRRENTLFYCIILIKRDTFLSIITEQNYVLVHNNIQTSAIITFILVQ